MQDRGRRRGEQRLDGPTGTVKRKVVPVLN
jgi:hypothetical protein